jgi:hypothetical protein
VFIVAGIGVGGSFAAALLSGRLDWRNLRRAAHEPAVAAARLIKREMETAYADASTALEMGTEGIRFSHGEWDAHKAAVAGRLSQEELMVLDTFYRGVRTEAPALVTALFPTAIQAINWLAQGESNTVKPRRTEVALAPVNMDLPCRCGHTFGHHGWRAERRRIRLRQRHAKYKDTGYDCKRCNCVKYRPVGRLLYR